MVRKRDKFWDYVDQLNRRFKCKFCECDFPGGVPRIKSHLSGVRGRDIEICTKVPENVQAEAYLAVNGSKKKAKNDGGSNNLKDKVDNSSATIISTGLQQSSVPSMFKKKDKEGVDNLLARHVVLNNVAFNVVQTPSFIDFVRGVAEYGPGYKLPSYSTLCAKLIPDCRKRVEEYVTNVKQTWETSGCTLMSDIWSDMKQRSFINIIAYSPGGALFLNSFDISQDRKTGLFLKDIMSSAIDDIGADHVVQFITDNASNFEYAGDMLIGKYPHMYKTRCAAHGIQLLLSDIYENVHWVHDVFDHAKSIVTYMYKYTIVLTLMRQATNNKELKRPCVTRFASNYLMLQSIFVVENELRLFVASAEWRGLDYNKKEAAKKVTSIIQDPEFWIQGSEVLSILEPLICVLRLVDGDGSTARYLYEAMELAKDAIKKRSQNDKEKYWKMWELFEQRRSKNIIHPIHAAAAFLNPAYMCSSNFTEDREMKNGISFMLENLVKVEEKHDFIKEVQLYRMKVSNLFSPTSKTMLETSHPRVWWDYCGDPLPVLKKYAIRILSQPCSSSACERNWSAFEATQTKKRNKLSAIMLDDLVYVRMNTMMMEKFNTMEAQDLVLIDLHKLRDLPEYCDPPTEDGENDQLAAADDNTNNDPYKMIFQSIVSCPLLR